VQDQTVSQLLDRLTLARTFEDAAAALLGAAVDVAEQSLAGTQNDRGRIRRALVHLRPDGGYVRLVALEAPAKGGRHALQHGDGAHVPSATAWRWIVAHGRPVSIDVVMGEVTFGAGAPAEQLPAQKLDAQRSQAMLIEREVTHLHVVPLHAPGGRVDGMLAIEATCQAAIGEPFIWPACGPVLQAMASIAAPYLTKLPVVAAERVTPDEFLPVVGPSMHPVIEILRVFADQEETVLLSGPTGAGKTRLARWCHERSQFKSGPFEVIDLATVPEELQMAELFGWRKGAFTGAARDTVGAIARAEGGTLFIDEIDKLSLRAQAGLLRVLEEKRYRSLGEGTGDRVANVRFVIGTNADLGALSRKGQFREDLYYRINVLPVRIPGLRDRRDEILEWSRYMLRRRHVGGGDTSISPEAARVLSDHDWPGNLRQLDNIIRRAYALSMVKYGAARADVTLSEEEVKRALEYEDRAAPHPVWEHLELAADAFAREAERRVSGGEAKLDMDVADAFKGLVIEAARRRLGGDEGESLRRAYVLFGKESTVESRNQRAAYRRELDKIEEARRAFGLPPLPAASEGKKGK
jgi:DNA-binding NtrC family response regulator